MKSFRNLPASVRQRLLNRAKNEKRPFNELLQYYAMERFLYRLSRSPHVDCFVLKGALMLRVWHSPESFEDVVLALKEFLLPLITLAPQGDRGPGGWVAPGPWR